MNAPNEPLTVADVLAISDIAEIRRAQHEQRTQQGILFPDQPG